MSGDIEVECSNLLREHEVFTEDFQLDSIKYMEDQFLGMIDENENIIVPEEENYRTDLVSDVIFTIDPASSRDLDDALSIKHIKDDIYEVMI